MKTSFSTNDSLIDLIDRDNIVSPNRFLCRSDTYNNNGIITIQDESNDYSLIRETYNSNGIITIHDESDQVETCVISEYVPSLILTPKMSHMKASFDY